MANSHALIFRFEALPTRIVYAHRLGTKKTHETLGQTLQVHDTQNNILARQVF